MPAISIKALKKRIRSAFIFGVIEALAIIIVNIRFGIVSVISEIGTPLLLLIIVLLIWAAVNSLKKIRYCSMLIKKLENHEEPAHDKPWRKGKGLYYAGIYTFAALFIIAGVWFCTLYFEDKEDVGDYLDTLPYITMKDMAKDGTYKRDDAFYASNEIEMRSDILVPQSISSSEHADFNTDDGIHISGGMYVDYFEVKYEFMAKLLMWELRRAKHTTKAYHAIDPPEVEADDVFAYIDIFPTVVIRQGNKVAKVGFLQSGEDGISLDEWANAAADNIR